MSEKKKISKLKRREKRLQRDRQWIAEYNGTPRKLVKQYRKRFNVDIICAVKDLQEIGVEFTQEYVEAVKRSEEERIRQKHLKKQKREQELFDTLCEDCDDDFAFIAGYTSGGAPYGITWEEAGIDLELTFEERVRVFYEIIN